MFDIVSISILTVDDDWTDLEMFGDKEWAWLAVFLELPHEIPSHDTFRRVFGLLDRKEFAA